LETDCKMLDELLGAQNGDDAIRQTEYNVANSSYALTERGLRFLLENYVIVMRRRGITDIGGWATPENWFNSMSARIGFEPLFRLLWKIIKDTLQKDIVLHEVLNEDPDLFLDCMENGDLMPFYARYPQ